MRIGSDGSHSDNLKFLALGAIDCAKRYSAYNVNGFKFHTLAREQGLRTQNSGVFSSFGARSYASTSDGHMQFGNVPYYGKLVDINRCEWHEKGKTTCSVRYLFITSW